VLQWSYATRYHVSSSPAVAGGGVYVGSGDSRIYAFAAAATRPDLVVEQITWHPTFPVNGSFVTFNVTVKNIGNDTAFAYFTGQLSGDVIATEPTYFGLDLAPGETAVSIFVQYAERAGDLSLCYSIDVDRQVVEWDEDNNEKAFEITVLPSNALPDLVVTDIWHDEHLIWYQVMNSGNGSAPAGAQVVLWLDGRLVKEQLTPSLSPGQRHYFKCGWQWQCSTSMAEVKVCVDTQARIPEADETNNWRVETWQCDQRPPTLLKGPFVAASANSATITWQTSEPCNGLVRIDDNKPIKWQTLVDPIFSINHKITVENLKPSTGYVFQIESTDEGGNSVCSPSITFFTQPVHDSAKPVITLGEEVRMIDSGVIKANASDDVGIGRVEFYIDGRFVGADYSYPYELIINSDSYGPGSHDVLGKVFDLYGNSADSWTTVTVEHPGPTDGRPRIVILNPKDGDTISDQIQIQVLASDPDGMAMLEIYLDSDKIFSKSGLPVPELDIGLLGSLTIEETDRMIRRLLNVTLPFDTLNWDNGPHNLRVRGWDVFGNTTEWILAITIYNAVPRHHPSLVVTRPDVELRERPGPSPSPAGLVVGLKVRNAGDRSAEGVVIEDVLHGFYPTGSFYTEPASNTTLSGRFYRSAFLGTTIIQIPTLGAGENITIRYAVTPILRESDPSFRNIGATVTIAYNGTQGDQYNESLILTASSVRVEMESPPANWFRGQIVSLEDAVEACLFSSDYLIVTCPGNMLTLRGTEEEIGLLFQSVARLAWVRNGVIGLIDSRSED